MRLGGVASSDSALRSAHHPSASNFFVSGGVAGAAASRSMAAGSRSTAALRERA